MMYAGGDSTTVSKTTTRLPCKYLPLQTDPITGLVGYIASDVLICSLERGRLAKSCHLAAFRFDVCFLSLFVGCMFSRHTSEEVDGEAIKRELSLVARLSARRSIVVRS